MEGLRFKGLRLWTWVKDKLFQRFYRNQKKGDWMTVQQPISVEAQEKGHVITLVINSDLVPLPYYPDSSNIHRGQIALKTESVQESKQLLHHLKGLIEQLERDVTREELIEELSKRYALVPKPQEEQGNCEP